MAKADSVSKKTREIRPKSERAAKLILSFPIGEFSALANHLASADVRTAEFLVAELETAIASKASKEPSA